MDVVLERLGIALDGRPGDPKVAMVGAFTKKGLYRAWQALEAGRTCEAVESCETAAERLEQQVDPHYEDVRGEVRGLDPAVLWPDWPASIDGALAVSGTDRRLEVTLDRLRGRFLGRRLRGEGRAVLENLGLADIAGNEPLADHHVFNTIYSGLVVLPAAVMQLWEDGLLWLDDDVNGYLPFEVRHHDLVQPDFNIAINRNQLALAGNL